VKTSEHDGTGRSLRLDVAEPYLTEANSKALMDRLARIEGHIRAVRNMVFEHRCADEILLQVAAVKAALNQCSSQILEHELTACVNSCMQGSAGQRLQRVTTVLATLLKQT
jgi:DNA-binding FrmR family transcriptional regulator